MSLIYRTNLDLKKNLKAYMLLSKYAFIEYKDKNFFKEGYLPAIIHIKQKIYSAKELKLKKTKAKHRNLLSLPIEGVNFEQTYNSIFFLHPRRYLQKFDALSKKDFQKQLSFENNVSPEWFENKIYLDKIKFNMYYSLFRGQDLYSLYPWSIYETINIKVNIKKDILINELLKIYEKKVVNFTLENLQLLNFSELVLLQLNLDLTELETEIIREEGILYENINYFLDDKEYMRAFPVGFYTQKLVKELKNSPKNEVVKKPLKNILENSNWKSFSNDTFESSTEANFVQMCHSLGFLTSSWWSWGNREGDFQVVAEEVQKFRKLNINGIKIKNNSPTKYQRKYLEEFICYKNLLTLYALASDLELINLYA